MAEAHLTGLRGWLIDAPDFGGRLRAWNDGAIIIDDGEIAEVGDFDTLSKKPRTLAIRSRRICGMRSAPRSARHSRASSGS